MKPINSKKQDVAEVVILTAFVLLILTLIF